jgi:hypothetical protein
MIGAPVTAILTLPKQSQISHLLPKHKETGNSVRVRVTLQLTVSQSVSLGVEPNLGLLTRDLFFFFLKVTVLSFGGALSDERSGFSENLDLCYVFGLIMEMRRSYDKTMKRIFRRFFRRHSMVLLRCV